MGLFFNSKTMKLKAAIICMTIMLAGAYASYAQSGEIPQPTFSLKLYPEGQNVDKGLEGAMGPKDSNGFTQKEETDKWGSIYYITDPVIDIYMPEKPNGQMVVVCPGGGYWFVSSLNEGAYVADWMNERGIAVCVVKYRLPNGHWEIPLQDVQNAFRYCRSKASEWGIDQIGVMGFSAGGHLAASATNLFTDEVTRPDFSILIYPVISMDKEITHMGTRIGLIGMNPDASLEERYSLDKQVTENTPPSFITHCTDDDVVPIENTIRYYRSLVRYGVPAEVHIFPKSGHGWGFTTEKFAGKGNDGFSYARNEFETSLERWMNGLRK